MILLPVKFSSIYLNLFQVVNEEADITETSTHEQDGELVPLVTDLEGNAVDISDMNDIGELISFGEENEVA